MGGLYDDRELLGAVALGGRRRRAQVATRLEGLGAPAVEGVTRDLGFAHQVGIGLMVGGNILAMMLALNSVE